MIDLFISSSESRSIVGSAGRPATIKDKAEAKRVLPVPCVDDSDKCIGVGPEWHEDNVSSCLILVYAEPPIVS